MTFEEWWDGADGKYASPMYRRVCRSAYLAGMRKVITALVDRRLELLSQEMPNLSRVQEIDILLERMNYE